jgi:uncharacterized protein (TIGR00645 family)
MDNIKRIVEAIIFGSRWLLTPFLLGLIIGLVALLYKFFVKLVDLIAQAQSIAPSDAILGVLNLVDLTLTANLITIIICSSYDNFLSPLDPKLNENLPGGLVRIGFSGLKQKLLGSIVAIAAVNVLEWFMDIDQHTDNRKLIWVVGILMAFSVTMLILAVADRVSGAGRTDGD